MAESIRQTITVELDSGLRRCVSSALSVDAYDVIDVTIADGAKEKEVQVQPGGAAQIQYMLITSDPCGAGLTYKVNSDAAEQTFHQLDAPQVFMGTGAFAMLDAAAPTKLFFSNSLGKSAALSILVGRKAAV